MCLFGPLPNKELLQSFVFDFLFNFYLNQIKSSGRQVSAKRIMKESFYSTGKDPIILNEDKLRM